MTYPLVRFESAVPAVSLSNFLFIPNLLAGETVGETDKVLMLVKCGSAVVKTVV